MKTDMEFNIRYLSEVDKKEICSWKYEKEYAVYNLPSYEMMKEKKISFTNPKYEKNFRGFYYNNRLIGFTNILEEDKEVLIGIGVNPKLCSKGYGQQLLALSCEISKSLYPTKSLYLVVRTWNARAINCYKKVGFRIDGEPFELKTLSGLGLFYRMVKE